MAAGGDTLGRGERRRRRPQEEMDDEREQAESCRHGIIGRRSFSMAAAAGDRPSVNFGGSGEREEADRVIGHDVVLVRIIIGHG